VRRRIWIKGDGDGDSDQDDRGSSVNSLSDSDEASPGSEIMPQAALRSSHPSAMRWHIRRHPVYLELTGRGITWGLPGQSTAHRVGLQYRVQRRVRNVSGGGADGRAV
jgi:hypothetical protein